MKILLIHVDLLEIRSSEHWPKNFACTVKHEKILLFITYKLDVEWKFGFWFIMGELQHFNFYSQLPPESSNGFVRLPIEWEMTPKIDHMQYAIDSSSQRTTMVHLYGIPILIWSFVFAKWCVLYYLWLIEHEVLYK